MSRYVRPSGDGPEYTDVLKAQVERLTAELDAEKEISAALTFDREQLRAELETERCLSFREQVATLEAQLTETRDLAEHWAILAEQRRVELGECRKDVERYRWLRSKDVGPAQIWECIQDDCNPPYWMLKFESELDAAIDAAMEAKP